jgi:predicted dehydrogenase
VFQPTGYLSLDLAAGTGEFLRLKPDALRALAAHGAPDLATVVELVRLSAADGEPLGLELTNFVQAVRGSEPVAVTGEEGLEALRIAFRVLEAMKPTAALAPA